MLVVRERKMENALELLFYVFVAAIVVKDLADPGWLAFRIVGVKRRKFTVTWVTDSDEEE